MITYNVIWNVGLMNMHLCFSCIRTYEVSHGLATRIYIPPIQLGEFSIVITNWQIALNVDGEQ